MLRFITVLRGRQLRIIVICRYGYVPLYLTPIRAKTVRTFTRTLLYYARTQTLYYGKEERYVRRNNGKDCKGAGDRNAPARSLECSGMHKTIRGTKRAWYSGCTTPNRAGMFRLCK